MKIKTEILQSTYIVTCEGPGLVPQVVEVFLTAMKVLIQKNNLDILFDLSAVESVEGANIGAVARFLETIEGHGCLIICGLNERDLNLLKMSHLGEIFLQASNRNEALSTLFWEKKKAPKPVSATPPDPQVLKGKSDKEDSEIDYEIEYDDVEEVEVETDDWQTDEEDAATEGEELAMELPAEQPFTSNERRKFCRIKSSKIMDGDFVLFCKNSVTGKHYTAVVEDIGFGGLLMTLSPPIIADGEELLLEGRIGKLFKFKERAVLRARRQDKFAFEFVDLSPETSLFLSRVIAT